MCARECRCRVLTRREFGAVYARLVVKDGGRFYDGPGAEMCIAKEGIEGKNYDMKIDGGFGSYDRIVVCVAGWLAGWDLILLLYAMSRGYASRLRM